MFPRRSSAAHSASQARGSWRRVSAGRGAVSWGERGPRWLGRPVGATETCPDGRIGRGGGLENTEGNLGGPDPSP